MGLKILIISNNCLSTYNSNGRTLLNLLGGFNSDELYQFYVANEVPQEQSCKAFLRITDKDVIGSYFKCKKSYSEYKSSVTDKQLGKIISVHRNKTAIKSWIREFIWNSSKWVKKKIIALINEEKINLIILQAGDNIFLHRIARKVAQRCGVPLLVYNTEDYYYKDYDYMKKRLKSGLIYKLYHHSFCNEFRKLMRYSKREVYNCEGLHRLYDDTFNKKSEVIYTATDFKPVEQISEKALISYAGNLGCGRHTVLIDIANALQEISNELYIDVYGPNDDTVVSNALKACAGVRFHGFVPYAQVCQVIKDSVLLVHVESFDSYYRRDTRFAFSTKLADYMASNMPIFICAPESSETYMYMKENEAAFVARENKEIREVLYKALFDADARNVKKENALILSQKNNNYKRNGERFREIIKGIITNAEQEEKR